MAEDIEKLEVDVLGAIKCFKNPMNDFGKRRICINHLTSDDKFLAISTNLGA